jgi:hypothetical protein
LLFVPSPNHGLISLVPWEPAASVADLETAAVNSPQILSLADVDRVLGVLAVAIEPVAVHLRWRPQLRDPDDELVLEGPSMAAPTRSSQTTPRTSGTSPRATNPG